MISILCPSRGRPMLAKKMVESALQYAKGDIEILLYLNNNDPSLPEYLKQIDNKYIIVGEDRSPNYTWNLLSEQAMHDYMFVITDDAWFETQNWDEIIVNEFNEFPDKILFVYPSIEHIMFRGKLCTEDHCPHFVLHKNWIKAVGYFTPPMFWHWCIDLYWRDAAKLLGRSRILRNVKVQCLPEYTDATEQRKNIFCNRERDIWLWKKPFTKRYIQDDANLLKQFIDNYKV